MKKITLLGLSAVMALSASAQFTSGGAASESEATPRTSLADQMKSSKGNNGFTNAGSSSDYSGRFNLGYNMWTPLPDGGGDSDSYNGFFFEWLMANQLSRSLPLYFDWGLNMNFNYYSNEEGSYKSTCNMLQMAVPLQVEYRLPVGDNFHISPYLGLIARVNLLAMGTTEMPKYNYKTGKKSGTESKDVDYFDKDDMGEGREWKRFQIGWNIGVNFDIKAFTLGVSYGTDFMEIAKKCKSSTFKAYIGFTY